MEYRYLKLADELEKKIRLGRYRTGEKLPSLRTMRQQTGRSMSTVYHAYNELEQRGLVDVREKSGFFIRSMLETNLPRPCGDGNIIRPHKVAINSLATMLQQAQANPGMIPFGTALPGPGLLPRKQLAREVRQAADTYASGELLGYCHPSGHEPLCAEIEKRMVGCFDSNHGDEVVVTGGCMAAIDLCLRAVAKAGDVILVESPTFLCYLQLIEDLNMRALEIPVDPESGIDLALLQRTLKEHEVQAALLNTNFHNPLGYVMGDTAKKDIVEIFARRSIPIIEDDIYGDLYFGETRPTPLKFFDREGLVLYCSSFSKTLAPDLRIGWTVAGRYREKIKRVKFNSSVASQQLSQHVIACFLASGAYERHLRKMRNALKKQLASFQQAIVRYFPADIRMSAPKGGLCLWLELNQQLNTMELFELAKARNITLVPGALCSATNNYSHCLRLNFGYPWSDESEKAVQILGSIVADLEEDSGD